MIRHQTPSMQNKSFLIDAITKAIKKDFFVSYPSKNIHPTNFAKLTK
jgi:hypothetical protein